MKCLQQYFHLVSLFLDILLNIIWQFGHSWKILVNSFFLRPNNLLKSQLNQSNSNLFVALTNHEKDEAKNLLSDIIDKDRNAKKR